MAGCCTHTHTQQDVVVQYTPVQFRWLVVTDSENGDRVSLLVMIAEVPEHSAWPAVSHGAVLVRSPTVDSYFHWLSLQTPGFSVTIITRCTQHTQKSHFYLFVVSFSTICMFVALTKALLLKVAPYFVSHYNTFIPNHTWTKPQEPTHRSDTFSSTYTVGIGLHRTTDLTHSVLLTLWGLGCTTPQIWHIQFYLYCGDWAAPHHRSNTFSSTYTVGIGLHHTTDLTHSVLLTLWGMSCTTP